MAGGSAGALLGPLTTGLLVVPIGFQNLLPISASLLLFDIVLRFRHGQHLALNFPPSRKTVITCHGRSAGNLVNGLVPIWSH